jgi:6-pyruvoyl-tetrahydropterin synthase
MRLKIRHNMEIAHRLSQDTTKCKQIHGHGMQVELTFLNLTEGSEGMAMTGNGGTMEFGAMKRAFRNYIDTSFDHHLLLNQDDPWATMLRKGDGIEEMLPGLTIVAGEPTVENLAKWIAEWAAHEFRADVVCSIDETRTNGAEVFVTWNGFSTKVMK